MLGLCLKRTRLRALMQNLQTKWFDRALRLTSYPSKWHNYKRGNHPWLMITIDNMHQGYIFRVCSVVLLVVQCYRFWWCSLCLLALLHVPSWGWGGRRGSTCTLYFVAAVALCVHIRGAGANLNTVKRIVTLHWNQTNLIYIFITIYLKKGIPSTSCSDWQPSMMYLLIACFITLLLMLLLAKVKVDVFRVWPCSL